MDYRNWYCVMVASGCENKAKADLLARRAVLKDTFIKEVFVPEATELTFDKSGKRKAVKEKILPGYILVQVEKETIIDDDGEEKRVFPPFTQKTIRDTFNVLGFAGANKNRPYMMKPSEVQNIFHMSDGTREKVKEIVEIDYSIGEILDVISGPFAGQDITVTSIQGSKILGQVEMFGRTIPAEALANQVKTKELS